MELSFNPRTRAGCDEEMVQEQIFGYIGFNPRTRAGCD